MTDSRADTEKMNTAANAVDNTGQVLANIRGNIQSAVDSTATGYTSPAATLFRNTMGQWDQHFAKILNDLQRMHEALRHNTVHYQATMETERDSANQLAALLNGTPGEA